MMTDWAKQLQDKLGYKLEGDKLKADPSELPLAHVAHGVSGIGVKMKMPVMPRRFDWGNSPVEFPPQGINCRCDLPQMITSNAQKERSEL